MWRSWNATEGSWKGRACNSWSSRPPHHLEVSSSAICSECINARCTTGRSVSVPLSHGSIENPLSPRPQHPMRWVIWMHEFLPISDQRTWMPHICLVLADAGFHSSCLELPTSKRVGQRPWAWRNSLTTCAGSRCSPSTSSFMVCISSAVILFARPANAALSCGQRSSASCRTRGTAWYGGK